MPLIDWRDEFEIGIEEIDYEHRELIALINEAYKAFESAMDPAAVAAFFGEIYARILAHFALEESIMQGLRYDEFDAHKAEHEELLDDIRDIMDGYERGEYAKYQDLLAEHLEAWFTEHFKNKDSRLHRFIEEHKPGQ